MRRQWYHLLFLLVVGLMLVTCNGGEEEDVSNMMRLIERFVQK